MESQQRCILAEGKIAYQQMGVGAPLLLVHGITTYSFIWRKIIPMLSQSFQVTAIDLLGCGASDMPLNQSYSLNEHARRMAELIDSLGLDNPHYIGHDLGGGIGQILAVQAPDKVRSLTLINSVAHDFWPVQPITIMRTPIVRQLLMSVVERRLFRLIVNRGFYHKELLTDELMELFWRPFNASLGRKAFLHFAKCLDNQNLVALEDDIRRLQLPVLILRGDADVYLSSAIAEKLQKDIQGSKLLRIGTASHYLMEDEPQWTAEQIINFIREQSE